MKITEKLKRTSKLALMGHTANFLALAYLIIVCIKGVFFWTSDSTIIVVANIHAGIAWLINSTYFFPLNYMWENIPTLEFHNPDVIAFYKIIIPPALIIVIGALFVGDHRALKAKYRKLKAEVQDEIIKRRMLQEAGYAEVPQGATLDVFIKNATNTDPAWHNKWWGKLVMAVATALLLLALGLK